PEEELAQRIDLRAAPLARQVDHPQPLALVIARPRPAPRLLRPAALEHGRLAIDLVFHESNMLRLIVVGTGPRLVRHAHDPRVGRYTLAHEANRFLAEPYRDADRDDANDKEQVAHSRP